MTAEQVLKNYKVEFIDEINLGKSLLTNNQMLTSSIFDHYNLRKANQLLDDINSVLNGVSSEIAIPTQSLYLIDITYNTTKIYDDADSWEENNNITPTFILPTDDFKIIIIAWRDYLI